LSVAFGPLEKKIYRTLFPFAFHSLYLLFHPLFTVHLIFLLLLLNCNGHPWHERSQLMRDRKLAATPSSSLIQLHNVPHHPLYCLYISFMTFSFFQFVQILNIIILFVYWFFLLSFNSLTTVTAESCNVWNWLVLKHPINRT